ncbi:MAG: FtsZ-binding cell division protein ZapB [Saprospiraceae bacterium]|jgi:FtsZ-binding cell division protein ZapB
MKRIFTITILAMLFAGSVLQAQSLSELKEKQLAVSEMQAEAQAKVDELQAEIDGLQKEIDQSSGWRKGLAGVVGFNMNRSNNWAKNANPSSLSSGLSINGTGYAILEGEKAFLRNTGILNLAWQKVDPNSDVEGDETNFARVTDILNISSLAGYKLSDIWALSGLGEINTSVGSFFSPGTFDVGVGGAFTGIENLVVVVHPLNMHFAFPAKDVGFSAKGFFGLKLRADYANTFSNGITWATNFTSFSPYSGSFDNGGVEVSAFEWTWLNTITFPVYKGVGLGISFGLRDAAFEFDGTQNFYTVGLSYNL